MKTEKMQILENKLRKMVREEIAMQIEGRFVYEASIESLIKANKKVFYRDINILCDKLMKQKNIKSYQHTGLDYTSWNKNKFFFTILSQNEDISKEIAEEIYQRTKRIIPNVTVQYERVRNWNEPRQFDPNNPKFGWRMILTFADLTAFESYESGSI